ncbi:hypothetical protein UFOVP998_14 [uncultured Caudovirales phage]|uniref:Uncharacterized protein n=1 Tax=uncultured Caudovirales phage TaxID=2100421 RepID=A0A6J5S038_9CAUD|nr:hypothetical protein UFOVP998_14 [uncultured Caudovirales phage]CAB4199418.1 hypothetical protein UFOVP1331_45 [uncultured Caudovirales phage]CAB4212857.1 hypothetical protein UFOVP1442_30 [uncultured Caudovirales phage]CAB5228006.1 hypothetical protein UFOVP1535_21 [uncultured Caudovirales phage]
MSLNARFTANFDDFKSKVDSAQTTLGVFERGIKSAARELTRLEESYSGQRVVAQAIQTAEAVERVGGVTKLTAGELESVSRIAAQATEKLMRIGESVPQGLATLNNNLRISREELTKSTAAAREYEAAWATMLNKQVAQMDQFGVVTVKAAGGVSGLGQTYRQFDGVLASAGVHIGPQVKALEDISNAASGAGGKIGFLGGVGLVLGTGMAAWGITRAAMEFTGLDKSVEGAWRSLLKYGDVVAETAGAKQDVINRAIAHGAAATISYTEAIKFNTEWAKRNGDAKIDWGAKLAAAQREVRGLTAAQIEDIETAQRAGASVEQLTNKYGVSALALTELATRQRDAAAATKAHEQAQLDLVNAQIDRMTTGSGDDQKMEFLPANASAETIARLNPEMARLLGLTKSVREEQDGFAKALGERVAPVVAEVTARIAKYGGELATLEKQFQDSIDAAQAPAVGDDPASQRQAKRDKDLKHWRDLYEAQQISFDQLMKAEQIILTMANDDLAKLQASWDRVSDSQKRATESARQYGGAVQAGPVLVGAAPFGNPGRFGSVMNRPAMADGGIVHGPTNILAGERGPEAIVPLPKLALLGNTGGDVTVHVHMTGVLLSSDPGGKKMLKDAVGSAVFDAVKRGKKV